MTQSANGPPAAIIAGQGNAGELRRRAMLEAMIGGQRDPRAVAQLAIGRVRARLTRLEEALTGHFDDRHTFICQMGRGSGLIDRPVSLRVAKNRCPTVSDLQFPETTDALRPAAAAFPL